MTANNQKVLIPVSRIKEEGKFILQLSFQDEKMLPIGIRFGKMTNEELPKERREKGRSNQITKDLHFFMLKFFPLLNFGFCLSDIFCDVYRKNGKKAYVVTMKFSVAPPEPSKFNYLQTVTNNPSFMNFFNSTWKDAKCYLSADGSIRLKMEDPVKKDVHHFIGLNPFGVVLTSVLNFAEQKPVAKEKKELVAV